MTSNSNHILVVEDDKSMQTLLKDFLTSQGYKVTCCSSGIAALKAMQELSLPVDAVVADLVMPGLDGVGLLKAIRVNKPHLPLILITAFPHEDSAAQATQYGAAAFFIKPFKLSKLASALQSQLPHRK